ncbi:MAG: hypothetical protein PHE36_03850 [Novosphingobium sp.]|nr:hypothetical protein [Novosphingobium sp.]
MRYLQADPKTGILRYRRTFPERLRAYVGKAGETLTELKVSLGARSITEPCAMDCFEAAARQYAAMVSRAEKLAAGTFDNLDSPKIAFLVETYRSRELADDAARRLDPAAKARGELVSIAMERAGYEIAPPRPSALWSQGIKIATEVALEIYRDFSADGDLEGILDAWREKAVELAASEGLVVDPSSPAFRDLCVKLNETAIAVHEAELERMDGKIVPTPPMPEAPVAQSSVAAVPLIGPSFREIVEGMLESPRMDFGEPSKAQTRTALRYLCDALGDLQPHELTRAEVSRFLDLVARRPARVTAKERALPLADLVQLYADKDVERVNPRTLEKHCRTLGARWTKAQAEEGLISERLANPFTGRKFEQLRTNERKAKGFSADELRGIFGQPFFAGGDQPRWGRGETAYWLPLLSLFTGARPEELVQLVLDDVWKDPETGRWMLDLQAQRHHPEKGAQRLKTDKKGSGGRIIPVPLPLLSLNFAGYVQHLKGQGEETLFPQLRVRNKFGRLYSSFGDKWCAHIYDQGILPRAAGRQPMREFRHTWTTAARASGIARDAREYIQGRKSPGRVSTDDDYGEFEALAQQLDRLRFEVDILELVKPWRAP